MKTIRMYETGGPDVLRYEECPSPQPGPGEARVDLKAVGINYTDVLMRSGVTAPSVFPATPGREGSGVVSAVGDGVKDLVIGDVVGYWGITGSYTEQQVVPVDRLIRLPPGVEASVAAAVLLQGLTAHFLVESILPNLGPSHSALVHAGAGGTGGLLIQLLKRRGVQVFTTVGTDAKVRVAREAGADRVIVYTRDDFCNTVLEGTHGRGVDIVYDAVGRATYDGSIACSTTRGCVVLYGRASGDVAPDRIANLERSICLIRPRLGDFTLNRKELVARADELLGWVASGDLTIRMAGKLPLRDAAHGHRLLESRETMGKLILIP